MGQAVLPISVTCSKWYIRKAPLFSGLSLWTRVCWVSTSNLNKLVFWKLWCPATLRQCILRNVWTQSTMVPATSVAWTSSARLTEGLSVSSFHDQYEIFFAVLQLELRPYTLSHSTSPFLWRVFHDRVSWTILPSWLQIAILLISASWVAGIIGMSHWHPAIFYSIPEGLLNYLAQLLGSRSLPISNSYVTKIKGMGHCFPADYLVKHCNCPFLQSNWDPVTLFNLNYSFERVFQNSLR
jgi:hypothetical protein